MRHRVKCFLNIEEAQEELLRRLPQSVIADKLVHKETSFPQFRRRGGTPFVALSRDTELQSFLQQFCGIAESGEIQSFIIV